MVTDEPAMRIVTFNVQHARTPAGRVDSPALADYCAGLGADVLGLQEVDVGVPRSGRCDQADAVARATGMVTAFGAACRVGVIGRFGNALLVRGGLTGVTGTVLPRHGRHERRAALLATVDVGRSASVAVTHLSVDAAEAAAQLDAVLDALGRRPPPRVLLGDLNRPGVDVAGTLAARGFTLADPTEPTFPADDPRYRIDHVAVDGLEVLAVEVLAAAPVSDHRALLVEVG